jgi:hypothetical protein
MFKEGDFDSSYRARQLDTVVPYVVDWLTLFKAEEQTYQCKAKVITSPAKNFVYLTGLSSAASTYQSSNFAAFEAAEAAAFTQLAVDIDAVSEARQLAWNAFVGAGAVYINESNPLLPPLSMSDPTVAAYLSTPMGRAYRDQIEIAVLGALQLSIQYVAEAEANIGAGYRWGYHWRPSYGSHYSANGTMSEATVVEHVAEAIANADNSSISLLQCIAGNTDIVSQQGDPIRACLFNYVGVGVPPGAVFAGMDHSESDTLTSISKMQSTIYNFGSVSYLECYRLLGDSGRSLCSKTAFSSTASMLFLAELRRKKSARASCSILKMLLLTISHHSGNKKQALCWHRMATIVWIDFTLQSTNR